ncbi:unnamed protein product [Didymodactylos carnosus]|uniref:Uncharacterized protein n=1 Tax=Didymodactylos carnosus TaxID=1234261 RepID=A0A8S2DVX9_9BILA|nr:unnamed protein product [Didymodactylos carnosus]CAF3783914.1 unnamed protein product [Didymodactylos carnosus]
MINGFVYTVDKRAQATETMIDKMANFGTNAVNKAAVLGSKTMKKTTNVSSSAVNSLVNVGTHAGTQLTEVAKGTIAEVGQTTGSLGVYIGFGVGAAVLVVVVEYGVDYECVTVEMFLNLYKDQRHENKVELFCGQNVKELIYNYSNSIHFKTDASINMIKPFTNICLTCKKDLDLQIKEKVYVFTSEAVQKGMIYYGECCCVKYYPNAYVRRSRRIITLEALYGKKYLYLGGKNVYSIQLLLRYSSDVVHMFIVIIVLGRDILLQNYDRYSSELENQILLDPRTFENPWLLYSTALFTFLQVVKQK